MRRLWKKFAAWFDGLLEASERRKCRKQGHDWRQTGALHPEPLIWFECGRMGCDVRTNPTRAHVTWHGTRAFTLSPVADVAEGDWPEVLNV